MPEPVVTKETIEVLYSFPDGTTDVNYKEYSVRELPGGWGYEARVLGQWMPVKKADEGSSLELRIGI